MKLRTARPKGVILLAIFFIWIGIGGALFPVIAGFDWHLAFGWDTRWWRQLAGGIIHSEDALRITSYCFAGAIYLNNIAYGVIGFGLWKLRNWARRAILGLFLFWTFIAVMAALFHIKAFLSDTMDLIFSFLLTGSVFWYFMRPRVRYAFEGTPLTVHSGSDAPSGI